MSITWYAPKAKQSAEVKVTKSSIVITESGLQKLLTIDIRFTDVTHVKLGWDGERSVVAIAPAEEGEKGVFKVGRRGRNQNMRTINAAKFFDVFSLIPDPTSPNDLVLKGENGIAMFRLNLLGVDTVVANGVSPIRRRRGRAPKVAA